MAGLASDPLTGLPGRAAFHATLTRTIARDESVGLIVIDFDGFAGLNQALGQAAGDAALIDVGMRLANQFRDRGTVARIDGDEFAVILPGVSENDLREAGQLAHKIVAEPRAGSDLALTASIGTALAPQDGTGAWELVHAAAVAQFVAQSTGRARVVASKPVLSTQIERSVRDGIACDSFSLNYQPIVTLDAAPKLVALEAFLRWQHPTRGLIFPANFLPLLEEPRVARQLGCAALAAASAQVRRWTDQRVEFGRIGLNLSVQQLRDENLVAEVEAALARKSVSATTLALELPRDIYLLGDLGATRAMLERLVATGVTIVVDGWSPADRDLAALTELPVSAVKLDRTFTERANEQDVSAAVAQAKLSNVMLVAQGVESADTHARLASLGVDLAQGWFIGRPMPGNKVGAFNDKLASRQTRLAA